MAEQFQNGFQAWNAQNADPQYWWWLLLLALIS
jgi:hypothetical protein